MIPHTTIVSYWAREWRNLSAWGAPLPATFTIKPHKGQRRLGRARVHGGVNKAEILTTGDLAEDLCTALHELAHLAAPGFERHGQVWRDLYVRATAEALRVPPSNFDTDVDITDLDAQVKDAVKHWLTRTGQARVLQAIGVTP